MMLEIIKKHGINHFVNFMRNGTTVRFDAAEVMVALAYLETRMDGSPLCAENCTAMHSMYRMLSMLPMLLPQIGGYEWRRV